MPARKKKNYPSSKPNPRKVKLPSKWTNAKVRVDAKGRVQIGLAKNPFLGKGGTLAKGVKSVKAAAKKVARKVKRNPRVTVEPHGNSFAVLVDGQHHETVSRGYFPTKTAAKREAMAIARALRKTLKRKR